MQHHTIPDAGTRTLQGFVAKQVAPGATLITDEASGYEGMPFDQNSISARRFSTGPVSSRAPGWVTGGRTTHQ